MVVLFDGSKHQIPVPLTLSHLHTHVPPRRFDTDGTVSVTKIMDPIHLPWVLQHQTQEVMARRTTKVVLEAIVGIGRQGEYLMYHDRSQILQRTQHQ